MKHQRYNTSEAAEVLQQLRNRGIARHEARFFYYDARYGNVAVKVMPGEYYVDEVDHLIMTTLGSCIAVCLWDRYRAVGGLNHFMLPEGSGESGRYGSYAMELLVNALLKRGASRSNLEAKVFGGAAVIQSAIGSQVGMRNTEFALQYLQDERIAVVSKDVLGPYPRQVCFLPASGRAMVRRFAPTRNDDISTQEHEAEAQAAQASRAGGTVDLF